MSSFKSVAAALAFFTWAAFASDTSAATLLYVTPLDTAPVVVLNTSNGSVVNPSFTGGNVAAVTDVAFGSGGDVYLAAFSASKVNRYNSSGVFQNQLSPAHANEFSLAVGPLDGALYQASQNNSSGAPTGLGRSANPATDTSFTTVSGVSDAIYIAFGPVTGGLQPLYFSTYSGGAPTAVRMANLDASGNVIGSETDFISAATLGMTAPQGVAIGPKVGGSGNWLYVAGYDTGTINRYDLATGSGGLFATLQHQLTDIALDSAGDLYAANFAQQTVTKLLPTGTLDPAFGTAGTVVFTSLPYGLAIFETTIPEPSSLLLLVCGGLLAYRWRQSASRPGGQ